MITTDPPPQILKGPHVKLDLSRRPALLIKSASLIGGSILLLLGLLCTGVGLVIGWGIATSDQPFTMETFFGLVFGCGAFLLSGMLCLYGAFGSLLVRRQYLFETDRVTCESRHLLGTTRWHEPYSAFRGVHLRLEMISSRYGGGPSYWRIDLGHPDPRKTVPLFHQQTNALLTAPMLRLEVRRYAELLKVPIVEPPWSWGRRLLWRRLLKKLDDPWPMSWNPGVKPRALGPGSTRSFDWYFTQESTVHVTTIEDVVAWLVDCQYASDEDLFDQSDFWQHPRDFEQRRRGDCEDHALWAWRKLLEFGLETRFFVGYRAYSDGRPTAFHAWVTYTHDDVAYLVETTRKQSDTMIETVAKQRADYCPHFSVGRDLRIRSHRGYVLQLFGWAWTRRYAPDVTPFYP